jgi:hypothetical protein
LRPYRWPAILRAIRQDLDEEVLLEQLPGDVAAQHVL